MISLVVSSPAVSGPVHGVANTAGAGSAPVATPHMREAACTAVPTTMASRG